MKDTQMLYIQVSICIFWFFDKPLDLELSHE